MSSPDGGGSCDWHVQHTLQLHNSKFIWGENLLFFVERNTKKSHHVRLKGTMMNSIGSFCGDLVPFFWKRHHTSGTRSYVARLVLDFSIAPFSIGVFVLVVFRIHAGSEPFACCCRPHLVVVRLHHEQCEFSFSFVASFIIIVAERVGTALHVTLWFLFVWN